MTEILITIKLKSEQRKDMDSKGLSEKNLKDQINIFKQGTQYLDLVRPARLIDGIIRLKKAEIDKAQKKFPQFIKGKKISKFVPASGAATRMFKDLYQFLENGEQNDFVIQFLENIKEFAFYPKLKQILKTNNFDIDELITSKNYNTIIEFLLYEKGLSYGTLPKGLIDFHTGKEGVSTPIVEQIKEASEYAGEHPELVFTISEKFENEFVAEIETSLAGAEGISYKLSYQKAHTDTVAVTKDFEPVVTENNELLLRPGGHGSLIENLNDIDADLIFVKNIDNVCSKKYLKETVRYKKTLGQILLDIQKQVFAYSKQIENYDGKDEAFNFELRGFFEQELGIFSMELCRMNAAQKVEFFKAKLNCPIRVCGMVKNEGEPGGGPFWVRDKEGTISLQIVESSQINHKDENQSLIFSESSHFNPVDIVCSVKDKDNNKYDLTQFVDKDAVFISGKSYKGNDILALEHPGLWNGGMGKWNTIFVEVSSKTFNPVKTVNDLLREAHQN